MTYLYAILPNLVGTGGGEVTEHFIVLDRGKMGIGISTLWYDKEGGYNLSSRVELIDVVGFRHHDAFGIALYYKTAEEMMKAQMML